MPPPISQHVGTSPEVMTKRTGTPVVLDANGQGSIVFPENTRHYEFSMEDPSKTVKYNWGAAIIGTSVAYDKLLTGQSDYDDVNFLGLTADARTVFFFGTVGDVILYSYAVG